MQGLEIGPVEEASVDRFVMLTIFCPLYEWKLVTLEIATGKMFEILNVF